MEKIVGEILASSFVRLKGKEERFPWLLFDFLLWKKVGRDPCSLDKGEEKKLTNLSIQLERPEIISHTFFPFRGFTSTYED